MQAVVVVGATDKDHVKCWKVDGTNAPGRGGRDEKSVARYNYQVLQLINVHVIVVVVNHNGRHGLFVAN